MHTDIKGRVAIIYPGDREIRKNATPDNNRLASMFRALADVGLQAEPVVYHDDFREEVRPQLMAADAVLVWMNPIQDGHDRSILDPMLHEVSAAGIFVSTHPATPIRVRQAKKGSVEETITMGSFFERCEAYFEGEGRMIDQAYQARLPDGMVRCYMVHDQVVGFGQQAVNALFPPMPGAPPSAAPQPGPRLYHPPTKPEFQALKHKVETKWVPDMQQLLNIDTHWLPILWDCDFLFGPRDASGNDTHVLCEINVSSIAPFPESAPSFVAAATLDRIEAAGQRHV